MPYTSQILSCNCAHWNVSICPGIHFAEMTVFLSCATALATLNIAKCVENGMVVEPVMDKTPGSVKFVNNALPRSTPFPNTYMFPYSHPVPFKCSNTSRAPFGNEIPGN